MTVQQAQQVPEKTANGQVPPLVHGQRLSREEFESRYDAMPELKKAELIEGVVYMPSPVRIRQHSLPHMDLSWWLGTYRAFTPGLDAGIDGSVRLGSSSMPQPDALMFVLQEFGGQVRISSDDYIEGGLALAAEVASSSIPFDLGHKLEMYHRYEVREYLVWRIPDLAIDWFVRSAGGYKRLLPDAAGIVRSEVFPGLWLDVPAMVRRDLRQVFGVLQQGMATPDYTNFVTRLQRTAASRA